MPSGLEPLPRIGEHHVDPAHLEARSLPAKTVVHLLPNYDECLIAFADRSDAHDTARGKVDVTLLGAHFVLVNGRLVGGYRLERGKTTTVVVRCFEPLSKVERTALAAEVERLGTFLGSPVALQL